MGPILDGLKLMAAGMGFVFSFLVIMIIGALIPKHKKKLQ